MNNSSKSDIYEEIYSNLMRLYSILCVDTNRAYVYLTKSLEYKDMPKKKACYKLVGDIRNELVFYDKALHGRQRVIHSKRKKTDTSYYDFKLNEEIKKLNELNPKQELVLK